MDRKTGELQGRFETAGPIRHSLAVVDRVVCCCSEDGHLCSLDIKTGIEQWRFKAAGPVNTKPIYVDGLTCFGSADGHLCVLH